MRTTNEEARIREVELELAAAKARIAELEGELAKMQEELDVQVDAWKRKARTLDAMADKLPKSADCVDEHKRLSTKAGLFRSVAYDLTSLLRDLRSAEAFLEGEHGGSCPDCGTLMTYYYDGWNCPNERCGEVVEGEGATVAEKKPVASLGVIEHTARGFEQILFVDHNGRKCSLQASSLAVYEKPGTSAVWLGSDETLPHRMHLNREQVEALIAHLQKWLAADTFGG